MFHRLLALSLAVLLGVALPAPFADAQQRTPARPGLPPEQQPLPEPYVESLREDPYADIMREDIAQPVVADVEDPVVTDQPGQLSFNLKSAVERGLEANPQIRAARFSLQSGEYSRRAALGEFGFKLDLSYAWDRSLDREPATSGRPDDIYQLNLRLTQPLFTGFRLLNSYQRATLVRDQGEAQLAQAELQLILAIQVNYLELLRARMDLKSREDAVARLESQLKVSQAFYEVGLQPRLDVLQAETELANAQQLLLRAKNVVSTQVARLNTLLDLPIDAPVRYEGELLYTPFELPLESALEQAYRQRPDLTIARKSVEIAQRDAGLAASRFYPSVSGQVNYYRGGDDPSISGFGGTAGLADEEWTAGAALSWNIFEWGATQHNHQAAKHNVGRLESALANARLEASFEVKANLLAIRESSDRIRAGRTALVAAREGFRMALARYQAQVGTYTEVLDAQSRVTESEALLSLALADYQRARAGLYASIGTRNLSLRPM